MRFVSRLLDAEPALDTAINWAKRLSKLLQRPAPDDLDEVLAAATGTLFVKFAASLRCDFEAISAALVLPWTTSPVEGQISRIKMLKRTTRRGLIPLCSEVEPRRFTFESDHVPVGISCLATAAARVARSSPSPGGSPRPSLRYMRAFRGLAGPGNSPTGRWQIALGPEHRAARGQGPGGPPLVRRSRPRPRPHFTLAHRRR